MQPLFCPRCKVVYGNTMIVREGQSVTCHHCGSRNVFHFEELTEKPRNLLNIEFQEEQPESHAVVTVADDIAD